MRFLCVHNILYTIKINQLNTWKLSEICFNYNEKLTHYHTMSVNQTMYCVVYVSHTQNSFLT